MNAVKQGEQTNMGWWVKCVMIGTGNDILWINQWATEEERKDAFKRKFWEKLKKPENATWLQETIKWTTEEILKIEPVVHSPQEVVQKIIWAQDIHNALLIFNKINTEKNKLIIISKIFEYKNKLLSSISEIQHNFKGKIAQQDKIFELITEKNQISNILLLILNTTNSTKIKEFIIKTELESKEIKKWDYINLLQNLKPEDETCIDIILNHVINNRYRPILSIKNDSIELDFKEKLIQKYKTLIDNKIQEIKTELARKKGDRKTKEKLLKSNKNTLESSKNILIELQKEKLEYEKQFNDIDYARKKFEKARNSANTGYFLKTSYRKLRSILLLNKEEKKNYLEKYKKIDRQKLDRKIICVWDAYKRLERYTEQLKENSQKQEWEMTWIENFEWEISRIKEEIEEIDNIIKEFEAKIDRLKKEKVELIVLECSLR